MHLPSSRFSGEVEADESYYLRSENRQARPENSRGNSGFGLLKRNGNVYTAIISYMQTEMPIPIIVERVEPDSIVYTDCFWHIMPWM